MLHSSIQVANPWVLQDNGCGTAYTVKLWFSDAVSGQSSGILKISKRKSVLGLCECTVQSMDFAQWPWDPS